MSKSKYGSVYMVVHTHHQGVNLWPHRTWVGAMLRANTEAGDVFQEWGKKPQTEDPYSEVFEMTGGNENIEISGPLEVEL